MPFLHTLIDRILPAFLVRRRLRLTVEKRSLEASARLSFIFTLTNRSRREIEVTRVWLATSPPIEASRPYQPLPKQLQPGETWETWIDAGDVPEELHERVVDLARARLSNGHEVAATAAVRLRS